MKALHIISMLAATSGISWSYELHEWGTFTTVSGSDGVLLSGLQREEEPLPPFVHSHLGMENGSSARDAPLRALLDRYDTLWPVNPADGFSGKGLTKRPVAGVTVKMETPVIYFHSDKGFRAKVDVGFEGGTISQWYPARSGGESLPLPPVPANPTLNPVPAEQWRIDFSKGYRGSISWDVDVLSPADSARAMTFKPKETIGWMRARVPEANLVKTGTETEGYLFYRGIGNFNPGLEVKVDGGRLLISNHTGGKIPYLLVYRNKEGIPTWKALDAGLEDGARHGMPLAELDYRPDQVAWLSRTTGWWTEVRENGSWDAEIYQSLKAGLSRTGLLPSEGDAMIRTWWKSYFEADGTRVFWVLPDSKVNAILPLKVEPEPGKTVRVIVGRSEILLPEQEERWTSLSKGGGSTKEEWNYIIARDRFGLAIKNRVEAIRAGKAQTSGLER